MKKVFLLFITVLAVFTIKANEIIALEGHYQGKNLFVQNTIPESGVGYSIYEVKVNGESTVDELNSWAVEIDLASLNLTLGDSIFIQIFYKTGPSPKVINPEVLLPLSTFKISSIAVVSNDIIEWGTQNEAGKLTFYIEQFKWQRWIVVGEVDGEGTPGQNHYHFHLTPHSGENKVRVFQRDFTKEKRSSLAVTFNPKLESVKVQRIIEDRKFIFSSPTSFEVRDYNNDILLKGYGSEVDYSFLPKGPYYLFFDNTSMSFAVITE